MNSPLNFFISEQKHIVIATLVGALDRKCASTLEECGQEIRRRNPRWVILNFRDVTKEFDPSLVPFLARIQKETRALPSELRLAALHPELRKVLVGHGILRQEELCDNLAQALQSLSIRFSREAA